VRVMLLVTDLERGGTPLRLARLAHSLRAAGVDVHVGCLAAAGPVSRDLEHAGVPTFACGARRARDLLALWRLRHHVRRIAPDLIHSTLMHANVAARLVGAWCGVPVLGSTATLEIERRWHIRLERWTGRLERGHIVNSSALAAHVVARFGRPRALVHVIPPSVTPPPRQERTAARARLDLPPDAFVVLWAGRFDPVKRVDVVVRCAARVQTPAMFLLAGDGPARSSIAADIPQSPARERLRLLGWQPDLGLTLSAADAFLLPSDTEGVPNALLEALTFGLPCVARDLPTLRELAGDPTRLRLIPGDDAAAYAAALDELADDAELRQRLANTAPLWSDDRFTPAAAARAVLAIYRRVVNGGRGNGS